MPFLPPNQQRQSTEGTVKALKAHGRQYSDYMKMLALALYHYSARGYSLLSKFMIMPSKSSLCMWVQGVCIHPGLSNHMCSVLHCRFSSLSNLHKLAIEYGQMRGFCPDHDIH